MTNMTEELNSKCSKNTPFPVCVIKLHTLSNVNQRIARYYFHEPRTSFLSEESSTYVDDQRLLHVLVADQLHVTVFIVMNLNLQHADHLGGGLRNGELPFRPAAAIPV